MWELIQHQLQRVRQYHLTSTSRQRTRSYCTEAEEWWWCLYQEGCSELEWVVMRAFVIRGKGVDVWVALVLHEARQLSLKFQSNSLLQWSSCVRWSDLGPVVVHGVTQAEVASQQHLVGLRSLEVVSLPRGEYVPVLLIPLRTVIRKPDLGIGKGKD